MKKRNNSSTARSIFFICALLLLGNFLLGYLLLSQSKRLLKQLINDRMLDIVNTSSDMIDGDELEMINENSEGTPEYDRIFNTLKKFQDNIHMEFIYTVRDMKDGTFIFTVDPHETEAAEYGELVKVTPALIAASQGTPSVDDEPYEDAWGKFYSAYCPIYDSKGNVGGIVCIDFSADWYEKQLSKFGITVVLFSIVSLLIGASLVLVSTTKLRKRLRFLNDELGELSNDIEDLINEIKDDAKDSSYTVISEDNDISNDENDIPTESLDDIGTLNVKVRYIRNILRRQIVASNIQESRMITAMASDYRTVYYIDLDRDEGICFRADHKMNDGIEEGSHFKYLDTITNYANDYVAETERQAFLDFVNPDNIRKRLLSEALISHRYLAIKNGVERYEMLRMAGVRRIEDRDDNIVHAVGIGFSDVDQETRAGMEKNQALQKALEAAEEANIAKTSFLSSISHEIRTPMNAIIGLTAIAEKDPDIPPQTRDYLQKIDSSAKYLLRLINSILDMSRIESGRMILNNEEFSMRELLGEINTVIKSQCEDKGLSYKCLIKESVDGHYIGDNTKLKQVFMNILGNAVKFTPTRGSITFIVEPLTYFDDNATLRFTVKDTGIGMSKDFIPKIFDIFSQEDENLANKYGSTGLGMAITKNIIDMMNGKIEVDSAKGKGSTFIVTVTLKISRDSSDDNSKTPDEDTLPAKTGLSGRHILLVEDTEINAEIMLEVLDMRDISADHAENGQIAVDMFSKSEPGFYDAVLMDIRMPVMNGLEATEAIRALDRDDAKSVPIIALTANAFDEDVQRSLQAGMNAHLSKPVEPDLLFETLENLVH